MDLELLQYEAVCKEQLLFLKKKAKNFNSMDLAAYQVIISKFFEAESFLSFFHCKKFKLMHSAPARFIHFIVLADRVLIFLTVLKVINGSFKKCGSFNGCLKSLQPLCNASKIG